MKKFLLQLAISPLLFIACEQTDYKIIKNNESDIISKAVTDIDGNSYDAVKIGDQVWLASNLKTTRYPDGSIIPTSNDTSLDIRYCPDGKMSNVEIYGYNYTWQAAMHNETCSSSDHPIQGICPDGWHLPTSEEWNILVKTVSSEPKYLEKSTTVAKSLAAEAYWLPSSEYGTPGFDPSINNSTGFSALPADIMYREGTPVGLGTYAAFWTATEYSSNEYAYFRYLVSGENILSKTGLNSNHGAKSNGMSVRCVQDIF